MKGPDLANGATAQSSSLALKAAIATFVGGITLAVAAHVATGTDWAAIRAEWDRFTAAFWRAPAATAGTGTGQGASAAQAAGSPGHETAKQGGSPAPGMVTLPGLTMGDIKLPDVTLGTIRSAEAGGMASSAPVRSYTVFDVVTADGLRIVTGHEFAAGGTEASNAYCYAHAAESTDGIEPHVTLSRRKPGEAPQFPSITSRQAEALGRPAAAVEAAARAHCKI